MCDRVVRLAQSNPTEVEVKDIIEGISATDATDWHRANNSARGGGCRIAQDAPLPAVVPGPGPASAKGWVHGRRDVV